MGSVSVLVPFDFIHSVAQTSPKHFYSLNTSNSMCCCSFTYFCKRMKIFLGAQKYHHFEFLIVFKCVAIFHPLNQGSTPWYFSSRYIYIFFFSLATTNYKFLLQKYGLLAGCRLSTTHFLPLRILFLTGANAREGCCSRGALDLNKMRVLFFEAQKWIVKRSCGKPLFDFLDLANICYLPFL